MVKPYAEISADYMCDEIDDYEGDVLCYMTIDAWDFLPNSMEVDQDHGKTVATVFLSKLGNIIVSVPDPLDLDRGIKPFIERAKAQLSYYWSDYRKYYGRNLFPISDFGVLIDHVLLACLIFSYKESFKEIPTGDLYEDNRIKKLDMLIPSKADFQKAIDEHRIPKEYQDYTLLGFVLSMLSRHQTPDFSLYTGFSGSITNLISPNKVINIKKHKKSDIHLLNFMKQPNFFRATYKTPADMTDELTKTYRNLFLPLGVTLEERFVQITGDWEKENNGLVPIREIGLLLPEEIKYDSFTKTICSGTYASAFPHLSQNPMMITKITDPITFIPLDLSSDYLHSAYKDEDEMIAELKEKIPDLPFGFDWGHYLCQFIGTTN